MNTGEKMDKFSLLRYSCCIIVAGFVLQTTCQFYPPGHWTYDYDTESDDESDSSSSEDSSENSGESMGGNCTANNNTTDTGNSTDTSSGSSNSTESKNCSATTNSKGLSKGRPANPGEVPYQLSLWMGSNFLCGAALMESPYTTIHFGITSAHCLALEDGSISHHPREYTVRGGDVTLRKGQRLRLDDFMIPEQWAGESKHDIAIIFFHGQFDTNSSDLQPIQLPKKAKHEGTDKVVVSGWSGVFPYQKGRADQLHVMKIPKVSLRWCNDVYTGAFGKANNIDGNYQFCAGHLRRRKTGCPGDSGGPAVVESKKGKYLVGVVAFGDGCARNDLPGVYTRVLSYKDWILDNVARYERSTGIKKNKHSSTKGKDDNGGGNGTTTTRGNTTTTTEKTTATP